MSKSELSKEPMNNLQKLGFENKKTMEKIHQQKNDLLISPEIQEKIVKEFEKIIALGITVPAVFSLAGCSKPPVIEAKEEVGFSQEVISQVSSAEASLSIVEKKPVKIEIETETITADVEKAETAAVEVETTLSETQVEPSTIEPEETVSEGMPGIELVVFSQEVKENNPQENSSSNSKENEELKEEEKITEAIVIRHGPDKSKVSLTFDDCWSKEAVEKILEIVRQEEIEVTFFPTGRVIEKYPELWQQVIAEGHEIGNHTYSHPDLRKLSEDSIKKEIQKTQEALDQALGYHYEMKYLRPPGGGFNQKVQKATFDYGIEYLAMWGIDNGAITTFKNSPEKILPHLQKTTQGGEIILFHVSSQEIKILPYFIAYLKEKELKMVTIEELLIPPLPERKGIYPEELFDY